MRERCESDARAMRERCESSPTHAGPATLLGSLLDTLLTAAPPCPLHARPRRQYREPHPAASAIWRDHERVRRDHADGL